MEYLTNQTKEELTRWMVDHGEQKFRGPQLFRWVQGRARNWSEITNISQSLKDKLRDEFFIRSMTIAKVQQSQKDQTKKYLMKTHDHHDVESVLMTYDYGHTLCISSQIGCRMGCVFCASTLDGKVRNLTGGEMVEQILLAQEDIQGTISRVVVMGMGEPLDNYQELKRFFSLVHDKDGLYLSLRHITVSTCGLIPVMEQMARDFPQVNLAISLHRTREEDRSRLMPVNRKYSVKQLLKAAEKYARITRRRITFEYVLIQGENDGQGDLQDLIKKLRPIHCHVNLILLNEVEETGLKAPKPSVARRFAQGLESHGIPATLRRELGKDIDGACGQLRRREKS